MSKIEQVLYIYLPNNEQSVREKQVFEQFAQALSIESTEFQGFDHIASDEVYKRVNVFRGSESAPKGAGTACCHSGHIAMWDYIVKTQKTTAIFEHDCHPLATFDHFDIPDYALVVLGLRVENYDTYAPPRLVNSLYQVDHVGGSHGYALTPKTAEFLVNDIRQRGIQDSIDQWLFMRVKENHIGKYHDIKLYIADPPPCVVVYNDINGNIKQSTVRKSTAPNYNLTVTPGFAAGMKNG